MAATSVDSTKHSGNGKWIIAILVVSLLVLRQDNWFWTDSTLVFGFMPIALFYQACISIGASLVWLLATKIAWPVETISQTLERTEEEVSA